MRFGIIGGIIVVLSIWLATSKSADAFNANNHIPGKGGCRQLVTIKHPELKGSARAAEIAKCSANADAYSKQAGF